MRIEELDYHLPRELIAERPVEPRESSRLMVVCRKTGQIAHHIFTDLPALLLRSDLLVLNSARVAPARLLVRREERPAEQIEVLVLDAGASPRCHAWLSPARKIKRGTKLVSLEGKAQIHVFDRVEDGSWQLELKPPHLNWRDLLEREGRMPLPPYILKRRLLKNDIPEDREWYQTVFADRDGAVAAPTAGLHFSKELLERIHGAGTDVARIFLKVGPGTFQPIRTPTVEDHSLLPEEFEIGEDSAVRIRAAKSRKDRVIAVGTTAVRALESCVSPDGEIRDGKGETRLMILPGFRFRVVDALITNFHLPRSTLLGLVFALAGIELTRRAYAEAIAQRYRFYSYGDAMLIL